MNVDVRNLHGIAAKLSLLFSITATALTRMNTIRTNLKLIRKKPRKLDKSCLRLIQ